MFVCSFLFCLFVIVAHRSNQVSSVSLIARIPPSRVPFPFPLSERAHHFQLHVCSIGQSNLVASGNNLVSRSLKTLRQNLDSYVLFQSNLVDVRIFLGQILTGDEFQVLKQMYLNSIEESLPESPSDHRVSRPYLNINLTNSTAKTLKIR